MPVTEIPLDSSLQEEDVILLHGRNILIKLVENPDAQHLIAQPEVKVFLSTEDMSSKRFQQSIEKMIEVDDSMEQILQKGYSSSYSVSDAVERVLLVFDSMKTMSARSNRSLTPEEEKEEAKLRGRISETRKKITESIISQLAKLDEEIMRNEKTAKSFNSKLKLLNTVVISKCPKCEQLISEPEPIPDKPTRSKSEDIVEDFKSSVDLVSLSQKSAPLIEVKDNTKCANCGSEITPRNALNLTFHKLHESIKKLWQTNLWFEEYLSTVLKSLGWRTWPHVHVLGSSGIRHEVDVLGVKNGYVLVCECKTGKVSRQDVFNFWTKTYDIKSHLSILALIGALPEPETRQFILKNPSVTLLENLEAKSRKDIVKELADSVVKRI